MLRLLRPARALPLVIAVLLAAPAAANAWQVTVKVHGAGKVTENTDRHLMDCTTPASANSELSLTNCVAGTINGAYNSFDVVELQESVPDDYSNRGWRFLKWVDHDTGGNQINCDPQGSAGDHFLTTCQFQVFDNLFVDLYFDDTFGPTNVSLTGGPTGTTSATTATFDFNSQNDPDALYQCRLDRPNLPGSYFGCGGPADKSETLSSLTANGPYTFYVGTVDPSGNPGAVTSRSWTVDTTGPTTSIGGGPTAGSRTTSTSASFSLTANETATFQCRLDGPAGLGSFSPCSAFPSYTSLADGTYTFSARGTDSFSNMGPTATRTWTVDTHAPDTSITDGPTGTVSSNSSTFTFNSTESSSTFECKLDSGAWEPCGSSTTKGYTSLSDGGHTFRVRATDAVGLTDPTEAITTWTIDTVRPDTSIASGPIGETSSTAATFDFSASEPGTSFECKLDGGAWESCTSGKTYSGLGTGPHTFLVRATDAAGNLDQSEAVRSWMVTAPPGGTQIGADTTKPVATITVAKQRLGRVLKAGIVGSAASTEGGKLRLDVLMGRKKLLVATSKSRALGGPGSMKLTAKFTRKAKRALARLRSVKLTLRLTATDTAGNVTVTKKTLTLKR
jgi:hypothetical protein